jgi:hypothetical protein
MPLSITFSVIRLPFYEDCILGRLNEKPDKYAYAKKKNLATEKEGSTYQNRYKRNTEITQYLHYPQPLNEDDGLQLVVYY